jgi:hypothetical protein
MAANDKSHPEGGYANSMDFPGLGVAKNVGGAIGSFFSGSGKPPAQTRMAPWPGMGRGVNDTTWNQPPAASAVPPVQRAASSGGSLWGSGGGWATPTPQRAGNATGEPGGAAASNNSPARKTNWGLASPFGAKPATASPLGIASPFSGEPAAASSSSVIRTSAQARALPVTAHNQRRADAKANEIAANAPAHGDALNWGGIARDLGNAGDKRWAANATGEAPSTNAMKFVAANPAYSNPQTVAKARAGAGIKDRPVTNPGGWSRLEGGPRAKAASAQWSKAHSGKGPR